MVLHDVSLARAQSKKLSHLAQHDGLTDLPNSVLFNDRLTQAMALTHRHEHLLAVLFIDLDRFKSINDSLGHASGDRLLQSAAERLLSCVRVTDTVSRRGGDEFVILLSEITHTKDAAICAEKILGALNSPHFIDGKIVHITASIGIATYPGDGTEIETIMNNADSAMYCAKNCGRSNYQFFNAALNRRAAHQRHKKAKMHQAI
jgi:diguanylate cyclase (GGDEF)-like protein